MSNRETEWKVKQLNLRVENRMLHQRQQDAQASEYKATMVEHHSEAYILQTFVHKPAKLRVAHQPSQGLRHKQGRNILMIIIDNILFIAGSCFKLCAESIESCLTALLPAREAKEVAMLVTVMAMALLFFGVVSKAPTIYSSMSHSIARLHHDTKNSAIANRSVRRLSKLIL